MPASAVQIANNDSSTITSGGAMQPVTARNAPLTEYAVSSILNLICPLCGGPLGVPPKSSGARALVGKIGARTGRAAA